MLSIRSRDLKAGSVGSVIAAAVLAILITVGSPETSVDYGQMGRLESLNAGIAMVFIIGLIVGLLFIVLISPSINNFVGKAMWLSQQSAVLQRILEPFFRWSALTTTTSSIGLIYGIVLGVLVHLILLPVWLTALGVTGKQILDLSTSGVFGFIAWVVYGVALGIAYGLLREV